MPDAARPAVSARRCEWPGPPHQAPSSQRRRANHPQGVQSSRVTNTPVRPSSPVHATSRASPLGEPTRAGDPTFTSGGTGTHDADETTAPLSSNPLRETEARGGSAPSDHKTISRSPRLVAEKPVATLPAGTTSIGAPTALPVASRSNAFTAAGCPALVTCHNSHPPGLAPPVLRHRGPRAIEVDPSARRATSSRVGSPFVPGSAQVPNGRLVDSASR